MEKVLSDEKRSKDNWCASISILQIQNNDLVRNMPKIEIISKYL